MYRGVYHHNLAGTFLSLPYKKYINRRNEPGGVGGYNKLDKSIPNWQNPYKTIYKIVPGGIGGYPPSKGALICWPWLYRWPRPCSKGCDVGGRLPRSPLNWSASWNSGEHVTVAHIWPFIWSYICPYMAIYLSIYGYLWTYIWVCVKFELGFASWVWRIVLWDLFGFQGTKTHLLTMLLRKRLHTKQP